MNGYAHCCAVERRGIEELSPFLEEQSNGRFVMTAKGALSRHLQETVGDVIFNDRDSRMWTVEIKTEQEDKWGNLFIEMFSNRNLDVSSSFFERGLNPGWFQKMRAELLFYYFLNNQTLYIAKMLTLLRWAFGHGDQPGHIWQYKLRKARCDQQNDTWGFCVPITQLMQKPPLGVGMRKVFPQQLELWK